MTYAGSAYGGAPYAGAAADSSGPPSVTADLTGSGAFTATVSAIVTIAATLTGTGAFTADAEVANPSVSADITGSGAFTATAVPAFVRTADLTGSGAFTATILRSYVTDASNRVGGRDRQGYGVATWEPAVVEPPAFPLIVHNKEKARAFTEPTILSHGRPSYSAAEIVADKHRTRILVGGKDVTFFRDVPTPRPSYRLIEPLDYGAGTLELPQVSPAFETLGVGSLKWLRKGKRVIVQRVNVATNAVVATDYRGFISDFSVRGNTLVCELGGEVSGRAALMDKQPPLFRTVMDVGRWVFSAVSRSAPVKFTPRLGPVTGIRLASRGGTSMLDYINELVALAGRQSGAAYTVGRRTNGTWGMWAKDVTTVDATIYLDGARMVADLHNSLAEEPNRIYVTGINPDGQRIRNGRYPGLRQGDPAPYPMFDNSSFGAGTTNGDTDTGDGISVMLAHMVTMGYLSPLDNEGVYDSAVVAAVKRLQDDADLSVTGVMNVATWNALYDLDATGFSLTNSRIEPMAARSTVRKWRLTATGAIAARNPNYDPHKPKVDHSINVGSGFTRRQMRDWAREELREANTPNWVGTITCHLAAIEGEHNPGDPLTSDMLKSVSAIKPGMNVWVPNFDGGTLFHVSGKEVPGDGPQVLTVDTRARDTMAAWECITRNRESRVNPARAWLNSNRSSQIAKDAFIEWDEIGGVLDDSVHLQGGTWNVFPVLAGQAGTVQRIRIRTVDATRYAVAVFARKISPARLNHLIPNPLTEAGTEKWDKPAVRNALEDRGWVYQAGRFKQRCGYWPGVETDDDGVATTDPITGEWQFDAGFGYATFAEPVLYVAIWPLADTKIPAGRIMWNQLEAGA